VITIEVTGTMLKHWGACDHGVEQAEKAGLLPAMLCSEAEDNYELAKRIVDAEYGWRVPFTLGRKMALEWADGEAYYTSYSSAYTSSTGERSYKTIANWLAQIVVEAVRSGQ